MVEKGMQGGICHTIHRYTKANNKYMKNYDINTKLRTEAKNDFEKDFLN